MDYREAVRVIWPGEVSGVVARAVNLSPTGILVDAPTPTPCPVGSDVLCDVTLPRGPRLLRGRVAHRRVSPAKVGMGIEFVALSPREIAELRDAVDESGPPEQRAAQKVKVRFSGTDQVVRARAYPTHDGFRLATSLPFLKRDTEVDIALSPDATVSARGWVSMVALEHDAETGKPRLLIDVRVEKPDPFGAGPLGDRSSALTPVVETLGQAVPEHVWEPDEVGATTEGPPVESAEETPPAVVTAGPTIFEASGASPVVESFDHTEIVSIERRPTRWRALGGGMVAGALGLVAFVAVIVLMKIAAPEPTAPASTRSPVTVKEHAPAARPESPPVAAAEPAVAAAEPAVPAAEPVVAAREPVVAAAEPVVAAREPVEAAAAPARGMFELPLRGSVAGVRRYPLSKPEGVAFNLPHARAGVKVGTYHPEVSGLKTMWVRELPGGGTHLRFFFTSPEAAPRVELDGDVVRVTAR